jgi:hypothetical protein
MLVVMGAVIGFIVFAVLVPIFEMSKYRSVRQVKLPYLICRSGTDILLEARSYSFHTLTRIDRPDLVSSNTSDDFPKLPFSSDARRTRVLGNFCASRL